jgi:nitrate/nitrite-specific signal transduction histidine kinase
MASGRMPKPQSLRYISALTFALASILPLLLFLYIADRHSILLESDVSLLLGMSVVLAVLGLIYLMGTVKQLTVLTEDFANVEQGKSPRFGRRQAPHEFVEIARIVNTFNHMLSELKSNTRELENLVLKLSTLSELTEPVLSCWLMKIHRP